MKILLTALGAAARIALTGWLLMMLVAELHKWAPTIPSMGFGRATMIGLAVAALVALLRPDSSTSKADE